MFRIPADDVAEWKQRFKNEAAVPVLRAIARKYSIGRSALGLAVLDVCENASLNQVQAVWNWDLEENGKGISDERLEEFFVGLRSTS